MSDSREFLLEQARRVADGDVAAVPSPCVSVCRMGTRTGLCEGCLRTIDEIAAWSRMAEEDKRDVWALVAERIREQS